MNETVRMNIRLAFRVEGDWWNAYIAKTDTMDGARHIGSILMGAVQDKARKQAFMTLMRSVLDAAIRDELGIEPVWGDAERAPEHERAGRA